MSIKVLAADGGLFIRGGAARTFKACIGVAISFENPDEFKSKYIEFFEAIKEEYAISNPRYIFKSYDLKKIFGKEYVKIEERFKALFDEQTHINFVFSSFNIQKMPKVKYYQSDIKATESKSTMDFLNKLQSYYSYISAWKVVKEANLKGLEIYVDHFGDQEITKAWIDLNKANKVIVYPKGDQCNVFISSADLMLDLINFKMREHRTKLDITEILSLNIKNINIKNFKVFHSGTNDIGYLVPHFKENKIPKDNNLAHPLIYVIGEGVLKKETIWIENSEIYPILLRFAADKNSGLKFISQDDDFKKIREGDYLLYLGDRGKEKASFLTDTLGYRFKTIGLNDLLNIYVF